jgi:hypothetical protein
MKKMMPSYVAVHRRYQITPGMTDRPQISQLVRDLIAARALQPN